MDDILVIQIDPSTRRVSLKLSHKRAEGVYALIQVVVLSLLNVPGKDVLDPDKGGGLPAMIGGNIDPDDTQEVFAEIAQRVQKSEQEIIKQQIGLNISPEQKLREIQILGLSEGERIDEVFVKLRVVSMAGRITDIVV